MSGWWNEADYVPGGISVLLLDGNEIKSRISLFIATRLKTLPDRFSIKKIILLIPKSVAGEAPTVEELEAGVLRIIDDSSNISTFAKIDFEIITTECLSVDLALRSLPTMDSNTLLYVVAASSFRQENIEIVEHNGIKVPEDFWLPHLLYFAHAISSLIQQNKANCILDVGDAVMYRTSFLNNFSTIPDLSLMAETSSIIHSSILEKMNEWKSLIEDGELGKILNFVDNLPEEHDDEKPFLRANIFHRAGFYAQAQLELEKIKNHKNQNPFACILLSQVAIDSGSVEYAKELLEIALPSLNHPEGLELAIKISSEIKNSSLKERFLARLEELVPESFFAKNSRIQSAINNGNYQNAYDLLDEDKKKSEIGDAYLLLFKYLENVSETPNYTELIDKLSKKSDWKNLAVHLCVTDALRRELLWHANTMTKSGQKSEKLTRQDVSLIVNVLEVMLLKPNSHDFTKEESQSLISMRTVIRYISLHPEDIGIRQRVEQLLSTEVSGRIGTAVLTHIISKELARPMNISPEKTVCGMSLQQLMDEEKDFLHSGFQWLESISPFFLTKVKLPAKIVPKNPDRFEEVFIELIKVIGQNTDSEEFDTFKKYLALGIGLCAHMSNPNASFNLMFRAAKTITVSGMSQLARDIYESMLNSPELNEPQKRLAWLAMADVNCRLKNKQLSLLAMACSVMVEAPIELDVAYQQVNTISRVLRDLGLFPLARDMLKSEISILKIMGAYETNSHQIDFAYLQIDFMELVHKKNNIKEKTPNLINLIVKNIMSARARNDDVAPTFILLANIINFARANHIPVPSDADALLGQLKYKLEPNIAAPAKAVAEEVIKIQGLMDLHLRYENSRYSSDASYEPHGLTNAARKFISIDAKKLPSREFALAVELMTDRAMSSPGWTISSKPIPPVKSLDETADFLSQISQKNISIVMAALDDFGRMRRMITKQGVLGEVIVEDTAVFSSAHFSAWKKKFPFTFGVDEKTINLFFNEMDELGISDMPGERVIMAFEADLQLIPVNLLWTPDGFAGLSRRISHIPSISWLAYARASQVKTSKIIKAWIPSSAKTGGTLDAMKGYLEETLNDNNIGLVTDESLPKDFSGTQMSIVGAHGSLIPDHEFFFQRVSDESRLLVMTEDFANAFRNVGVVVLFVCSGGRTDSHPNHQTTIGLARTLLDKGCRAVVASPWPLNSLIPPAWLPKFLEAWKQGKELIDACFEANMEVRKRRGDDWAGCLAMTVYGDPLCTIND